MLISKVEAQLIVKKNKEIITSTQRYDKPNLSVEDKSKHLSLQFIFLFSWRKLVNYFEYYSRIPNIISNKDLSKFFANLNKYIPKSQKLNLSDIGLNNILCELFCTDFFRDVSKVLLYNAFPQTRVISNPESIIGIIVGLSLSNEKLVRFNLNKLLGRASSKLLNGIFWFIMNDSSLEKDIKTVWKKLKIRSDLTISLLNIVSNDKNKDTFNWWMKLWAQHWSYNLIKYQ